MSVATRPPIELRVEEAREEAAARLSAQKFRAADEEAEQEGRRAARGKAMLGVFLTLLTAIVVVALLADPTLLLVVPLLVILFSLPVFAAEIVTARRKAKKAVMIKAVEQDEERLAAA